jgi:hypothetical protein
MLVEAGIVGEQTAQCGKQLRLSLCHAHRYLLLARSGLAVTPEDMERRDYACMPDGLACVHVSQ